MFDDRRRVTGLNPEPTNDSVARTVMLLFRVAIVLVFVLLVGRLYQLQIVRGDSYRLSADNNRFRLQEVAAPRGVMGIVEQPLLVEGPRRIVPAPL